MFLQNDLIQLICKPLLVTFLLFYFVAATNGVADSLKLLIIAALLFSIIGDTLLMFANNNEIYFILGLAGFLMAHLFYILCFHKIKNRENIAGRWPWAVAVGIYYGFIMSILIPHLGDMKIPVLVYGMVISFMLLIAALLYDMEDNRTARYILTGAILFVVSDSVLALNKFYHPFRFGGYVIMTTYIGAQYLLVKGLVRYILKEKNN